MSESDGVPTPITTDVPVVSRTRSDDLTKRMLMLDELEARIEGPPDMPAVWDEDDTDVDVVVVDVEWAR